MELVGKRRRSTLSRSTLLLVGIVIIATVAALTLRLPRCSFDATATHSDFLDQLVIWSSDHHPAPASDVRHLLEPLGVRFLQTDLSPGYCGHFNLCDERRKNIKVINSGNMFHLDHALIPKFHAAYFNDSEMLSVDAFMCIDPPSICELYEPFNKSMIIIATNRYYVGRQSKESWAKWSNNLLRYAADPRTFIGANNLYDLKFVRFFTGLEPTLIPSFPEYTKAAYSYNGSHDEFLLANRRADPGFLDGFMHDFDDAIKKLVSDNSSSPADNKTPQLVKVSAKYSHYSHSDLAAHPGIVHLPYQISTMSLFEHFRMNIPLFFPSKSLLLRWVAERNFLTERVFSPMSISPPPHPSQTGVPHPLDTSPNATRYWIDFADFYRLPYITYFDSVKQLVDILCRTTDADLWSISRNMKEYNALVRHDVLQKWISVMKQVASYSQKPHISHEKN